MNLYMIGQFGIGFGVGIAALSAFGMGMAFTRFSIKPGPIKILLAGLIGGCAWLFVIL